jgi:hypothetical protein
MTPAPPRSLTLMPPAEQVMESLSDTTVGPVVASLQGLVASGLAATETLQTVGGSLEQLSTGGVRTEPVRDYSIEYLDL